MLLRLAIVGIVSLATAAAHAEGAAEETVVRIVPLTFVSAQQIAQALRQDPSAALDDLAAGRKEFVRRAGEDATRNVRPLPEMADAGLYPFPERSYAEVKVAQAGPVGGGGGLAALLPEGLSEPPIAVPTQNALMVQGTPSAIDQFREIVALLDQPTKQVNVELKLVNITSTLAREVGNDIDWRTGWGDVALHGPAPVGSSLRFGTADLSDLVGFNRASGRSNNTVGANVTATNNTPCVIRAATVIPFVAASVTYDPFGQRHFDYVVDSILTGVELFVVPRIMGDDRVSMLLRPSFIDKAGQVVGPDGTVIPITQEVALQTTVVVPDGETMLIGGLPRSIRTLQTVGMPIIFRQSATIEDVESLLFVTPRIVRSPPG